MYSILKLDPPRPNLVQIEPSSSATPSKYYTSSTQNGVEQIQELKMKFMITKGWDKILNMKRTKTNKPFRLTKSQKKQKFKQ